MGSTTGRRLLWGSMALALGMTAAGAGALAQSAGAKAVAVRQANFKQMGAAFKATNDELKNDKPNTAAISAQAKKLNDLAKTEQTWFPKGSGPEAGVKTAAKPEIWSDAAGFAAAVKSLQSEAAKLQQVSAGGNVDAVKAQVKATGGACGSCHNKYRVKQS